MTYAISLPLATFALAHSLTPAPYVFQYENVLGTSLELKVVATSPMAAKQAEARALAEIDREAGIFSGYDPASEFSRWMKTRGERVEVSPELFDVMRSF